MTYFNSLTILTTLFLVMTLTACGVQNSYHVSTTGNDSNPGTEILPFATIQHAKEIVADRLETGQTSDLTVYIGEGRYELKSPLIYSAEDGGSGDYQVIYKAVEGAKPVISGGVQIKNWKQATDGVWSAKIPETDDADWEFRELFFDGERGIRARHPNSDYLRMAKAGEDRRTNFFFNQGDLPVPREISDVELLFLHDWCASRIALKEIDFEKNQLFAIDSVGADFRFFDLDNWEAQPRFILENDMSFLDMPREWIFDKSTGKVSIILSEGLDPNDMEIMAPFAPNLIVIEGSASEKVPNLTFEGITFEHTSWLPESRNYAPIQASFYDMPEPGVQWKVIPSAVEISYAENCHFKDCRIQHLGGGGIRLGSNTRNCSVTNTHFSDISANGIMVGEDHERRINDKRWWEADPSQIALGNLVANCTVTTIGQQFLGAVGIWCGLTAETTITGNHVYDLPYSGVSVGWMWNSQETPCRDNKITNNHIHHVMQKLSDGAAIYMLGRQPGSKVLNNLIHDVQVNIGRAESNGIYLDQGSEEVTIGQNIIYNTAKSPVRFHQASTNVVRNNTLMVHEEIPAFRYVRTKEEDIEKLDNLILHHENDEDKKHLESLIDEWSGRFQRSAK